MNDSRSGIELQSPSPAFRIWTCGTFLVERYDGTSYQYLRVNEWGGSTYPRVLLKRLLCSPGRRARRGELLEDLWPDTDPKEASGYLNDAAYRLRAVLRPTKGQESLLVSSNDYSSYSLPGQERLWIDADAALALLEQAEVSERAGGKFLPLVEEAASYFAHGTFLEDEEGLWVYGRRGTLEQARHSCILWQAKLYEQRGWFRKAELLLCSLLEEDSTDEDVLCRLMVLLHLQQRTHEALRLYKHVVTLLAQDGLKPTASTRALVERLKTDTGQPIFQIMHNTDVLPSVMGRKEDKDRNDPSYTYHRAMLRQNTESDEAVNRREATQKIAALGLAFLTAPSTLLNISALKQLPERADSLKSDSETLSFFESLTQTCWQLSGGNELALAERILWAYLPKITSLALPPSHAQQGAARIVSQSYLLAASLAGHHNDLNARQHLSEQALLFGNLAQDRNLQIAALRQLAATFDYQDRPEKVLQTYQQAVPYLSEVSPLLRSRIYAGVSGIYAQMGQKQETIRYIGLAYESFPEKPEDDPSFLFADCGYFTLTLWEGLNHFELHQLHEAEKAFAQIDGIQQKINIPERVRSEILNHQAAIFAESRNMEQACTYLEEAVKASVTLGSARRYRESFEIFQRMQTIWGHEQRIKAIGDLFMA